MSRDVNHRIGGSSEERDQLNLGPLALSGLGEDEDFTVYGKHGVPIGNDSSTAFRVRLGSQSPDLIDLFSSSAEIVNSDSAMDFSQEVRPLYCAEQNFVGSAARRYYPYHSNGTIGMEDLNSLNRLSMEDLSYAHGSHDSNELDATLASVSSRASTKRQTPVTSEERELLSVFSYYGNVSPNNSAEGFQQNQKRQKTLAKEKYVVQAYSMLAEEKSYSINPADPAPSGLNPSPSNTSSRTQETRSARDNSLISENHYRNGQPNGTDQSPYGGMGRDQSIRFSDPPGLQSPGSAFARSSVGGGIRMPGIGLPSQKSAESSSSPFSVAHISSEPGRFSRTPVSKPPRQWNQGISTPETEQESDYSDSTRNDKLIEKFHSCMERRYRTKFIDTHCHLDFLFQKLYGNTKTPFRKFKEESAKTWPGSYEACITDFCDPDLFWEDGDNSFWCSILQNSDVYGAFGCHPHKADIWSHEVEELLEARCMQEKVIAVGEAGLDYSGRNNVDHEAQKRAFRAQITLAKKLGKPLVIHCRGAVDGVWDSAEDDCLGIVKELLPHDYKIHRHCFTLGGRDAEPWQNYFPNLCFGFTPLVVNPSKTRSIVLDAVRFLDIKKILVETDAPYFMPAQYRKPEFGGLSWGHPGLGVCAAIEIADLKNLWNEEVLAQIRENTHKLYGI